MPSEKQTRTIIFTFTAVKFLIPLVVILTGGYGIFRDELYYLACAEHPAAGYVDHPPLSVWILSAFTSLFGNGWQTIRLLPAMFGALSMFVLLLWVKRMEGNKIALITAGTAFLMAPINNGFTSVFSMNSIDLFFWVLCFYAFTVTLLQPDRKILWAILGLSVGLGMLNKISIAWFAIGLIVYLILSKDRKLLLTPGPYISGIIALLLFTPFIIWNIQHDMAHLTFAENASRFKYANISRSDFLFGMVMLEHPLSVILLIFSLIYLFKPGNPVSFKSALIIFFVTLAILLLKGQVKAEYMAGAFAAVFATGSIQLGRTIKSLRNLPGLIYLTVYWITGLLIIPMAAPILSEEKYIDYQASLGVASPNNEGKEEALLPQFYADMHGWKDLAQDVSAAYMSLPESSRTACAVWANNYGEAGAIDYYRRELPLPDVLSPHNNYYYWSVEKAGKKNYDTFIIIGGSAGDHERFLQDVRKFKTFECTYCMPYENHMGIFIGSDPYEGLSIIDVIRNERNFN